MNDDLDDIFNPAFYEAEEEAKAAAPAPARPKRRKPRASEGSYEFAAEFRHQTEKAVLVRIEGSDYWIPDSQIEQESEIYVGCGMERGDHGTIVMTDWIAQEKGLADEAPRHRR